MRVKFSRQDTTRTATRSCRARKRAFHFYSPGVVRRSHAARAARAPRAARATRAAAVAAAACCINAADATVCSQFNLVIKTRRKRSSPLETRFRVKNLSRVRRH